MSRASSTAARDVMTKGIAYCRDSEDLDNALEMMQDKKLRRLPVIEAKKRMVGMLALGDVCHAAKPKAVGDVMSAIAAHHA
jgi:CBS-domain-containing membrane protein